MTIKEQIIEYRQKNPTYRTLLGTVLGELDRITKTPTDDQCVQTVKKMIESNNMINSIETKEENFILSMFIPSQLSEDQIKNIISKEQFESIKDCMSFFKENHIGMYDGKLVSKLFNSK